MWNENKAIKLICNRLETGRRRSLRIGRDTGAEGRLSSVMDKLVPGAFGSIWVENSSLKIR